MKMKIRLVGGVMLTAISVVLFGSCVSDKDSSGLEYMPDMYRSPAIEPYVDYGQIRGREDADLTMLQSALTPPHGAIPYYGTDKEHVEMMMPWSILPNEVFAETHGLKGFDFSKEETYEVDALAWDWNPLKMDIEAKQVGEEIERKNNTLANAKKLYASNCMHCHGEKGDGKGPMMESGAFSGVPDYKNVSNLSDGQIFYSIYYGKGMMGSHASQLNKKEIWSLVHYIRKFQDEEYDKAAMESTMPDGVAVKAAPVEEMNWNASDEDVKAMKNHHMGLQILYSSGSAEIDMAKSEADLNHILKFMQDHPEVKIELAGHTDSSGDDAKNQAISEERSQSVKAWLVENGIDGSRIMATGYGETQLLMSEDGTENADASRRTELIIK